MKLRALSAASLILLALLLPSCSLPPGMRLFQAEYRVDSALVLAGAYDESDSVPIEDLWHSLSEAPMWLADGGSEIVADSGAPLQTTLSGDIEVRIVHAGKRLSSASVGELTLVRDGAQSDLWYPDTASLEKLAAAATY